MINTDPVVLKRSVKLSDSLPIGKSKKAGDYHSTSVGIFLVVAVDSLDFYFLRILSFYDGGHKRAQYLSCVFIVSSATKVSSIPSKVDFPS